MVVLPILLFWLAGACETGLGPVSLALQKDDPAKALALLDPLRSDCGQSSGFYELLGLASELSGQPQAAEIALQKAISLDPKSARLYEQLGAVYLRNKKAVEAAVQLKRAVALDPQNPVAKKYLIGAYVESGEWQKAATLFDQIGGIASDSKDPIMVLWFAQTLIETKQLARIDRDLSPEHAGMPPALLFSLGTLLAQHGVYTKAAEYFNHIPAADADDAVYFNLGLCYSHLQQFEEARKFYFLAIDKHPAHIEAYLHVGLDYGSAGQDRMAVPWLLRAHQWAPQRADIAYPLAEQLIQLQYFDTAQEVLAKALETNQSNPLLLVADGDLKQARGDADGAVRSYRKVLADNPGFAPALVSLARAEAAKGNDEEAQTTLKSALSADPNDSSAAGELGLIEARRGAYDSALTHLKNAWAQNRMDAKITLELARVYLRLNQPGEALRVLAPLQPVAQDSPALHLELAQIYNQLQRPTDAESERKRVTALQAQAQGMLHFESPKTYVH